MSGLAARLPLQASPEDGAYDLLTSIEEVAAQNIKMVVFTNPGERIMDPAFGVGIKRFLFRQNAYETHDVLRTRIREQIAKYLPYVEIQRILMDSALTNPELPENYLKVVLQYKIPTQNRTLVLELPISV